MKKQFNVKKLVLSGLLLAIGYVLPFLTGQVPVVGRALSPLHIPALLAGFICGPFWGFLVGLILPLSRSLLFGMPPLLPTAVTMTFEMATYGFLAGFLFSKIRIKNSWVRALVSLLGAMVGGRIVWGIVSKILAEIFTKAEFGWALFFAGAVIDAIPAIVLQIVLIPLIVAALSKAKLLAWSDR